MKNINNNLILVIVASVLIAGGVGFFAGTKYQQNKVGSGFSNNGQGGFRSGNGQGGGRMGGQFGGGNRQGFRPVNGEIISSDADSITVKMQDGSSRIVFISDKTVINKASQATKDELKVGEKVAAFGSDNLDGSMTAQNVQLNPIARNFQRPDTNQNQPAGSAQPAN